MYTDLPRQSMLSVYIGSASTKRLVISLVMMWTTSHHGPVALNE